MATWYLGTSLPELAAGLSGRLPRGRFGPYLEHGLAALARPGAGTTGAIVALGLGVMVVLSMWLVESRLGNYLRTALPPDAPSVFLVDVQPDQWDGVRDTMEAGKPVAAICHDTSARASRHPHRDRRGHP